jgi:hypothetical protein
MSTGLKELTKMEGKKKLFSAEKWQKPIILEGEQSEEPAHK